MVENADQGSDTAAQLERLVREVTELRREVRDLGQRVDFLTAPKPDEPTGPNDHLTANLSERDRHFLNVQIPREVEASLQLFRSYAPDQTMPPSGGWALSPLALLEVMQTIERDRPATVVECGSGTTSVWFGLAVQAYGGRVYSLEHDAFFADRTRQLVERHGLQDHVTILHAPLTDYPGPDGQPLTWYGTAVLDATDRDIDLLLVDGPPAKSAGDRRHTLTMLGDHLSPDAWIFVDDYNRGAEHQMVGEWLETHPDLRMVPSSTRQLAVLRRGQEG